MDNARLPQTLRLGNTPCRRDCIILVLYYSRVTHTQPAVEDILKRALKFTDKLYKPQPTRLSLCAFGLELESNLYTCDLGKH